MLRRLWWIHVVESELVEVPVAPADVVENELVEVPVAPADVVESELVEVPVAPADVVENELVEAPAESVDAPVEDGSVDEGVVADATQAVVEPCEEVPVGPADVVESELVEAGLLLGVVDTFEASVAKVFVAMVEEVAVMSVTSQYGARCADAIDKMDWKSVESSFSEVDIMLETSVVGPTRGLEEPTVAINVVSGDSVHDSFVIATLVDSGKESDSAADAGVPQTTGYGSGEVDVASEQQLTELSYGGEKVTPHEELDTEAEPLVPLTTKDCAEHFVKELMSTLEYTFPSIQSEESGRVATAGSAAKSFNSDTSITDGDLVENTILAIDMPLSANECEPKALSSTQFVSVVPGDGRTVSDSNLISVFEQTEPVMPLIDLQNADLLGNESDYQIDDMGTMPLEVDQHSIQDTYVPTDVLLIAKAFVSDIETKALSTILLWLQNGSGSESTRKRGYWDNEEFEPHSTRSIGGSCNLSDEQIECNLTTSELEARLGSANEEPPAIKPMGGINADEKVALLIQRYAADEIDRPDAHDGSQSYKDIQNVASLMDGMRETDAHFQLEDYPTGIRTIDIENSNCSPQELVLSIAYHFASQAITEALYRFSQPFPYSENDGNIGELKYVLSCDQDVEVTVSAVTVIEEGDSFALETPVTIGSADNAEGAIVGSGEMDKLPVDSEEMETGQLNYTNCVERSSSDVPGGEVVVINQDVKDTVESMVIVMTGNETIAFSWDKDKRVSTSEIIASPVDVATTQCIEIDDSIAVETSKPKSMRDPPSHVEICVTLNEGLQHVDGASSSTKLEFNDEDDATKLILSEMVDKVITDTVNQIPSPEAYQLTNEIGESPEDLLDESTKHLKIKMRHSLP
ncbi:unnamed protein product [Phytophthora fragariaefolia]|uniref:Unnamed protein product n=1 Tax=Phytophthora fragariaefolia TaxID=1490495 RepID=A0A9W6YH80_9STRA|nr:unnamed protein product [Phytophthora fragariaefolia]